MDPLVSVIVPIYNVEPWIRKCLDSLLHQTLKQIEVICIDDGSTDDSGRIADEYGRADPRFRVVHTENRGLSAARNRGIDEARAEYLMFVDSDDWVDEQFCEIPYKAVDENNADMVLFLHCEVKGDSYKKINRNARIGILGHEIAIDTGGLAVWRKLFSKKLFADIRFPEGQVYEDVSTTHKLIYHAVRIFGCRDFLYFHRVRENSISQQKSNDEVLLRMSKTRTEELIQLGYPIEKARAHYINSALRYCGCTDNRESMLYRETEKVLSDEKSLLKGLPKKTKLKVLIWRTNKNLFRALYRASRKRLLGSCK